MNESLVQICAKVIFGDELTPAEETDFECAFFDIANIHLKGFQLEDPELTLVAGNVRGFWAHVGSQLTDKCKAHILANIYSSKSENRWQRARAENAN